MSPTYISLGSWCRPAWQIRRHFGLEQAFPFDWHITSFAALMHTLAPEYTPADELRLEDCVISRFGSVMDTASGLVFQHDLPAAELGASPRSIIMREDDVTRALLTQAREKQAFLFARFRETCRNGPIVFVRWVRNGHPDYEWPEVFAGEVPHTLHAALLRFCGHSDIRTVYVTSDVDDGVEAEGRCTIHRTGYGAAAMLTEASRKFWAVDNWTGDSDAWTLLLTELQRDHLGL